MTPPVLTDRQQGVVRLTLNRPENRNALTGEDMLNGLREGISLAERDQSTRVLIITGAGTSFSAGGNVKDMAERRGIFAGNPDEIAEAYRRTIQQLTRAMLATDLVTIAAVNGPAIGAGFDLALGCDLRIGSPTARFAHTFVDLGIIPGDGGAWLLPRVVGWQRAAELAFTGRTIDAAEAVGMGVLLEVVEGDLERRASDLASSIASKPATSVRLAKRLFRHARQMDLDPFLDLSAALQAISHHTPEHPLAVAKYLERLDKTRKSSPSG